MATIIPFSELFNQTIYRIPDYQRGYSWTKDQLDDLWADLENTYTHRNAFHFTGILTVNAFIDRDFERAINEGFNVRENNNRKEIVLNGQVFKAYNLVDGQQRLTTILILLSQLIDALRNSTDCVEYSRKYFYNHDDGKNKYIFGYHVDVPSYNFLIHDIFEDETYDGEQFETLYTHNLAFAKNYFKEKISDFSQNEIQDTIDKITGRLLFSVLNLSESGENLDVSMIFETLNFRGKQLTGLERFKNRVLYLLSKQAFNRSSLRQTINRTWLEVYKWLGRNKSKPMDDDAFLKAFWMLYFSNSEMVAKDFKAYQKNLFEHDFSLLNIDDNPFMKPDELQIWLRVMRRAVKLWYFINNPYSVKDDTEFNYRYSSKIQRSLLRLNSFPKGYGRYMLNLILAVFIRDLPEIKDENSLTEDEIQENLRKIEDILWLAERHNIICFLLNGNNASFNQERTFRDVNRYYQYGRIREVKDELRTQRVDHFDWRNAIRSIHQNENFASWDGIHFTLREYEEILSGKRVEQEIAINLIYPDEEHRTQRIFYPEINNILLHNRRKYTYSLGNLYLSNNPQNQKSLDELKNRILEADRRNFVIYNSERELLNYGTWTTETIIERGQTIMNAIVDKWEIPRPPLNFYREFFGH